MSAGLCLTASDRTRTRRRSPRVPPAVLPGPLGRAPGAPLCPWLHPLDKLMMFRKSQGEVVLGDVPGPAQPGFGQLRAEEHFRHWDGANSPSPMMRPGPATSPDPRWRFDEVIQSWDTKYAKNNGAAGSWVVGQVWGRIGARAFLLDEVRGRWGLEETIEEVRLLSKKWAHGRYEAFEAKANGPNICRRLQSTIPGCYPWPVDGDKLT